MRNVVLLLLLWLMPWHQGQAFAHAALVAASPADGMALTAAPRAVSLRFDEAVGLIALTLAGPQGAVALAGVQAEGDTLTAALPAGLPQGTYLLSWRVTSADSHPVAGTVAFGVGVVPEGSGAARAEGVPWPSMALRAMFLAALLGTAGGSLFRLVAAPPMVVRRGIVALAWVAVALAGLQVGVRGALLAGTASLLDPGVWTLGGGTTLAASLAASAVGLMVCAVAWRAPAWVGAAGAVVAMGALPLSGHAGTAEPRLLTAPALALHGLAAAFWVGALWPLLAILQGGSAVVAVRRFSRMAVPAVLVLAASGGSLAVVQVGGWAALGGSVYGRVLLLKLAAVAALLGFAGWNKLRLTPGLARGQAGPLRRSIRAELALAGLVLAVTGVLGLTPPPRAVVPAALDRAVWTQADGIGALLEVAPGRVGVNQIRVTIDRPTPPRDVWLELRQAGAGVAAIRRPMRLDDGAWVYRGPELALPGRWTFRVEALLSDFDQTTFTTEMDIP